MERDSDRYAERRDQAPASQQSNPRRISSAQPPRRAADRGYSQQAGAAAGRRPAPARSGSTATERGSARPGAGSKRRRPSLPPWLLVLACLLFDAFFFHIWTENQFSIGRFLTLVLLSVAFALLLSLLGTISRKRKTMMIFAMVTVIFWGVMYLMEYFILDSFKNFYTLSGIFTGAGNAGQKDFASRTLGLVFKNLWRILLFALPIAAYFLANRFLRLPRILTRGMRRYLAAGGVVFLAMGLFFALLISPDRNRFKEAYNFTDAVHGFGLPMGFVLDTFRGDGEDFSFDDDFQPFDPNSQTGGGEEQQSTAASTQTHGTGATDANSGTSSPRDNTPTETQAPDPVPVGKQYNMLDLDYAAIIENAGSGQVAELTKYVSAQTPSKTNEMTGLFRGKNLILITAEAFSAEVIDPELTPTLYRMATKGIQFTDYYQPAWGGSTSSGEFSVMTGLEPALGVDSIQATIGRNMDVTIGNQLKALNYFTRAYHNNDYKYYSRNETHENLGYEKFIGMGNGMEEGVKNVWPASDQEMIDFTVPQYIDQQPFSVYYMSVSGHGLYSWIGNSMSYKNKDAVQSLPYSENVKAYLACNLELEYAMADLVRMLEEAGIADDTLVVLTADHYPYCLEQSDTWGNTQDYLHELYGMDSVNDCFQRDHNALIMWSGCLEDKNLVVDTPTFSLDIVPTLCNLFGVEFESRFFVGRDVFSDREPLVFWPDHSWKTDKGSWNAAKSSGSEFTPAEGVEVDQAYLDRIRTSVSQKMSYSVGILKTDYFEALLD